MSHRWAKSPPLFTGCVNCVFFLVRFETTRFGNPVMVLGKYRYNRWSYSKGPHVRWTCVKNMVGCRATIITMDNVIVRARNFHTHS
ncbi:unnamed protein product [Euphydryas editha]|uniref:FLYWCH-type domain-containing protein n=1 Tax=Euphydryas editha TaxID=104508 RepID=A0AAU9TF10_EUPED|nr:unnamed protein product [Euphydryas editha]